MKLDRFARAFTEREAAWERTGEELQDERNAAIRAARDEGLPLTTIAKLLGLSHQRISQILGL